jgi:hypothetical protein
VRINAVIFSDVDRLSSRSKLDEKISYVFISAHNLLKMLKIRVAS